MKCGGGPLRHTPQNPISFNLLKLCVIPFIIISYGIINHHVDPCRPFHILYKMWDRMWGKMITRHPSNKLTALAVKKQQNWLAYFYYPLKLMLLRMVSFTKTAKNMQMQHSKSQQWITSFAQRIFPLYAMRDFRPVPAWSREQMIRHYPKTQEIT